jgi:hypothetical protein
VEDGKVASEGGKGYSVESEMSWRTLLGATFFPDSTLHEKRELVLSMLSFQYFVKH